jgi:hypothetical protein
MRAYKRAATVAAIAFLFLAAGTWAFSALVQKSRTAKRAEQIASLGRQSRDPDADPEQAWQDFRKLRQDYPEIGDDLESLRTSLKEQRDAQRSRHAQDTFDRLVRAESEGADLSVLVAQTDQFLRDYIGTQHEPEVRRRRASYLHRLDERDFEAARMYSASEPLHFRTRREHYQKYLDKHPSGDFVREAATALQNVDADWDKSDFRAVRDLYVDRPGAIAELVPRCRAYQAAHPSGRFRSAVSDLLRWTERVTAPAEYRVVLRSGDFEHRIARFFSRGPDLSLELEVGGVRHGPSNIVVNRYDPDWDYEFPRRIRWKLGDPVRIRATDHDYWPRVVIDISSEEGDLLAFRMLSGDVWSGPNHIIFESDFTMPALPKIE